MKEIIGVRFRPQGRVFFFDPDGNELEKGQYVIVETVQGQEYGEVAIRNRKIEEDKLVAPLKKIIRIATKADAKHNEENKKKEKEAFKTCEKKIKEHKLDMKLTNVEYKFDNSKLLFYFTADGRIDFRDLVKDLAGIYRTRIELRQIGVRDEVRRIGGNGVCGRELCCCTFLDKFDTVSIKMAKEQNLSLNPTKISGNCGRLMCCLKYEQDVYEEKLNRIPKIGAIVKSEEDGEGTVDGVETLKEMLRIKFKDENGDYYYKKYQASEVELIKDAKPVKTEEEKANEKELKELEKLDREEKKNSQGYDE